MAPSRREHRAARARFRALPVTDDTIRRLSYRIYIDETGLETWQGQSLFGFAGVAGFGPELARATKAWKRMKHKHFGDEGVALHASRDVLTAEQRDAISEFFSTSRLRRFAVLLDAPPLELPGANGLTALRDILVDELADHIASLPKIPDDLAVVFETSDRLTPKIMNTFPGLSFEVEGADIERTVIMGFADKSLGIPMLEMADQVGHRAQRERRRGIPIKTPEQEFTAVFAEPRPPHALFLLVKFKSANYADQGMTIEFTDDGRGARFRFEGARGIETANRILAKNPGRLHFD